MARKSGYSETKYQDGRGDLQLFTKNQILYKLSEFDKTVQSLITATDMLSGRKQ